MKSFLRFSLIFLAVFSASVAQANDMEPLVKVAKENSKWVSFIGNDVQDVDLTLYDADKHVVYEERLKTIASKFRTYDLSALPEGLYTLMMESKSRLTTYQIEIGKENTVVSKTSDVEIKKPVIYRDKDLLTLDLNGFFSKGVEIEIYNEFNEQLHSVSLANLNAIKKYDVSKTPYRELTFVVRSSGQEYSETIKL